MKGLPSSMMSGTKELIENRPHYTFKRKVYTIREHVCQSVLFSDSKFQDEATAMAWFYEKLEQYRRLVDESEDFSFDLGPNVRCSE